MTPLIITSVLTFILLVLIIWLQFASSRNQTYFKIGAAVVLIMLVWLSEDLGKIYYAILLSIVVLYIIYKEYLLSRRTNAKE